MTDRGTEKLRNIIDAWGFDVVAHDDAAPSITVRPRDPRFDLMESERGSAHPGRCAGNVRLEYLFRRR